MKTMLVVDRIEGDWAVIEYCEKVITFNIPLSLLPEGIREGDVVCVDVSIDRKATLKKKKEAEKLLEKYME